MAFGEQPSRTELLYLIRSLTDSISVYQCNGGLKNAIESVADKVKHKLWVGTLGTNTDGFKESLRRNMEWRMREECSSVPVWIPDAEFAKCYDEFCHQVCILLWKVCHISLSNMCIF